MSGNKNDYKTTHRQQKVSFYEFFRNGRNTPLSKGERARNREWPHNGAQLQML